MKNKMPKIKSDVTSLRKLDDRKKAMSLNQDKSLNILTTLNSK